MERQAYGWLWLWIGFSVFASLCGDLQVVNGEPKLGLQMHNKTDNLYDLYEFADISYPRNRIKPFERLSFYVVFITYCYLL